LAVLNNEELSTIPVMRERIWWNYLKNKWKR
jgi:hypothetical protein